MPRQKPPSDARLILAAEMRASGASWEAIGNRLRRSPETVRKWPTEYPDRWRNAVFHAERRVVTDAEGEAVVILRQLLRSTDDKIRWHAAKALLALRVDLGKLDVRAAQLAPNTTSDPARLLVTLLETQTDEHLAQLVTDECERTHCLDAGRADAAADGPV